MNGDDRFGLLVARHLDRTLDAAGRRELAESLRGDAARRHAYLRLLEQDELIITSVREVLTPSARIDAARLPPRRRRVRRERIRSWTTSAGWAAAALVLVAITAVWLQSEQAAPFRASADGALVVERADARLPSTTALHHGDVLAGAGTLRFPDGGTVVLRADARLRLRADASAVYGVALDLDDGAITCDLPAQPRGFSLRTAQAQVSVVGTRFTVTGTADASHVSVDEGRVQVRSALGEALLSAGDQARITAAGIVRAVADSPARLDDAARWPTSGTVTAHATVGGVRVESPPARPGNERFQWHGRAWRWHTALPASAAVAVQARFAFPPADDGIWHGEVFLAPSDAHQDADEAQPSPCLRLAVRTGIPTVVRRTTPEAEPEVLWSGTALPAGVRTLRLELRAARVIALIDGREVWRGPVSYADVVPGLRWTRRAPGAAAMVIDQVALESLLP